MSEMSVIMECLWLLGNSYTVDRSIGFGGFLQSKNQTLFARESYEI
jgi:hypothetical protein